MCALAVKSNMNAQVYILSKIKRDRNGCWIWQGKAKPTGYTQVTWQSKNTSGHRLAYTAFKGDIPTGLHIDHLCRVRNCVNPDHLEAVTPKENALRGVGATAQNARMTHCKNGHEFTPENTYINPGKYMRICKTCRNAWHREYLPGYRKNERLIKRNL